jgi:PBP1b-binding outer membrane lipoprotein LpoB
MYTKTVVIFLIFIFLFSCKEKVETHNEMESKIENETVLYDNQDFEKRVIQDSLRILNIKRVEKEIENLKSQRIIGKWRTNHRGYKTNIVFTELKSEYIATINFIDSKSKPTINKLKRTGNKFVVKGSDVNEHYLINNDGNLELRDNQGLFTIGVDIYPSLETIKQPKFDIDKVLGMNIFTVTGVFSESNPKTLTGTNNEYWVAYYRDLNTTFKVRKSSMEIEKAVSGQISNLK